MSSVTSEQRIAAARLWVLRRHPYLAHALFALRAVPVPGLEVVAVDRDWRLYLDPAAVERWDSATLGSLLLHHAGHLLRDHAGRAAALGVHSEAASRWAGAADAEINDDLGEEVALLPGEPILPMHLGCDPGGLAEEYYARGSGRAARPGCGSGADGQPRPWEDEDRHPGVSVVSAHLLRCHVAAELLGYCRRSLLPVPAGWIRWAEALHQPKVDWRRLLAAEVRRGVAHAIGAVDYSYGRPSRRASVSGAVVLPALRRPVPEVAVVCDTSGSISDAMLGDALAEVEGLLRTVGRGSYGLRVLATDAAAHTARRVSSSAQVELVGGGGTDMGAGIAAALLLRPRPNVVVVFTDGKRPGPQCRRLVLSWSSPCSARHLCAHRPGPAPCSSIPLPPQLHQRARGRT